MFFFNDTATTEIYTLSLHDALPIFTVTALAPGHVVKRCLRLRHAGEEPAEVALAGRVSGLLADRVSLVVERGTDRKSTRLNSSHANISYAVFCLKKKKTLQLSQVYL